MTKETDEIIVNQVLENFSGEQLTNFGALAKSVEKANELKKLKRQAGTDTPGMKVLPENAEPYMDTLDEDSIQSVNGGGSGAFAAARNEGNIKIAREIMLHAGVPQELNVKQAKWLERFDKRYKP